MRLIFDLPEDMVFRKTYCEAYPTWLMEEVLGKLEASGQAKAISQLIWTLLHLGHKTDQF